MIRLIGHRLFYMLITMVAASMILFALFELSPSDVATQALGQFSTAEQRQIWMLQNGYDRPFAERYFFWLGRFVLGDLGMSRNFNVPVARIVGERIANTAVLGLLFFLILVPTSLFLGVLAGMREGSRLDRAISVSTVILTSLPPFASTVLVSAILVFWLKLLPGTSGMMDGFSIREMIMPVLVLLMYDLGYLVRITRASMVEVMLTPYIRTAQLKGIPRSRVILRHALRNALIAPFTVLMLHINWLIGGIIVVEFFFAYKGFGSLILEAAFARDLFLIEACTMVTVVIAVTSQTVADIGYTFLNPRIRFS